MSSYKNLSSSPVANTIGETIWDSKQPSNTWIKENEILSQSTYSSLYSKIGLVKNGLYSWTASRSNTTSAIQDIIYANGLYVYGANGGALATSTDAITWTARTSGTTSNITSLTYANGIFVYAGFGGALRTSTNAITWTSRNQAGGNFNRIRYGNGLYILCGSGGDLRTSTDVITWTSVSATDAQLVPGNNINQLEYLNNIFILTQLVSNQPLLNISTNGTTWSTTTFPNFGGVTLNKPFYNNGTYYISDNFFKIYSSTNATTWTVLTDLRSSFGSRTPGTNFIYKDGLYMCFAGTNTTRNRTSIATSTDLINWKFIDNINIHGFPNNLMYANNKYVCSALGSICWTADYTYNPSTEFVVPNTFINNQNSDLYFKGI